MTPPRSTYRLQFRNGMDFGRARQLVPYLAALGVTHLYASPLMTAVAGSTHGYDATRTDEIDPALGGLDGLRSLAGDLHRHGIGLILDIVPNHMAASLENPWWRSVVVWGKESPFSRHFDIDWSEPLTLPFLGKDFAGELADGTLCLALDPRHDALALRYAESFYPLAPESYTMALGGFAGTVLPARPEENPQGAGLLARTLAPPGARDALERHLAALSREPGRIEAVHAAQPWRLMDWKAASRHLSYRRFFEVTGLAGMRVEDGTVFDDMHRLILELVHGGTVDGLRIDHVDGLADPKAYLERLRHEAGADCYMVVEKILGEGEHIPADWPVSGTTGYEFIAALSDVFVDGDGLDALRDAYRQFSGRFIDMEQELRAAKLLMVDNNFAGEFESLWKLAMQIGQAEDRESALPGAAAKSALRELLAAFPVYRTYGTREGLLPEDREMLDGVLEKVRTSPDAPDPHALAFLGRILIGDVEQAVAGRASAFRTRFQQLTGPLMAKSVEDTLFYRCNMLLALNEVGAEPLPRRFALDRFHADMLTRLEREPDALSGTATHDTKRGEDTRARLYALSEAPDLWAQAVSRWREMNKTFVQALGDGPAPEPEVEWMLYQALVGAWPADLQPGDTAGLEALEERFVAYAEKALREAKLRTNWGDSNEAYEKAVIGYARKLLSPENTTFLTDFAETLQPFIRAGLVNSLTQTILKLTAPGVPDIYQGSEAIDLSLVDPDNRREPDFGMLQEQLSEKDAPRSACEQEWRSGWLKQHVIATLLRLRQEAPTLFRQGEYLPLSATGENKDNIVAFARVEADDALIVIAPRLVFAFQETLPRSNSRRWAQTEIALPAKLAQRRYRDIYTGQIIDPQERIGLPGVFGEHPFALLLAE